MTSTIAIMSITLVAFVMISDHSITAYAADLPEYCSDQGGQVVCIISILPYSEPGSYSPDIAEIPQGASVIFKNTGPEIHTSTSTDAAREDSNIDASAKNNGIFDTGIINLDSDSEPIDFDNVGVFQYFCAVHPDMRGTLIVGDAATSTQTTSKDAPKESVSQSNLDFTTTSTSDTSITGGELPLTKIKSVGNTAYIIDGTTPAGGHDAFNYDGSGHTKITGNVQVDLDPLTNTGTISAEWTDKDGNNWKYIQTEFAGGNELYIGETIDGVTQTTLDLDPVAINHFEHGTTGAGPTIEPTLFVYLASWGPAEVWKNGASQGIFEGHMMVTDGARNTKTGKIVQSDGTTPYSPKDPANSLVNRNAAQLHLVYHTAPAPEPTNNFPPPFEVFSHVMFYNLDPFLPVTHVTASNAYTIEGTTPAGGYDAFSYDGSGHKKAQDGMVEVDLDPASNTGSILAEWTDANGDKWKYEQTEFAGGNELYIGETIDGVTQTTLDLDPVAINHFEHGTTGAGPTIEPTLFVYLASWGPAEVWKNGASQGIFEGHMMVTDGARNTKTGKIVQSDGTTPYSPKDPANSLVNRNAAQLHLVYHTAPAPEPTNNFPPPFEVFRHTMFYDIDVLEPTVKPVQLIEPKTTIPKKSVTTSDISPLKQMKNNVNPSDVVCAERLQLIMKNSDGSAACVKPSSTSKLIDLGWGSFF